MFDQNEDGLLSFGELADIFHSARAREVEREIQLRPELAGLGVSDLRARAERDGVDGAAIEAAANSDAPEAGLIRLISLVAELPPLRFASHGRSPSHPVLGRAARGRRFVTRLTLVTVFCRRAPGRKKSSRDIVKDKMRDQFFDKHWQILWEVLSYEVLDAAVSGTNYLYPLPPLAHALPRCCLPCHDAGQHCLVLTTAVRAAPLARESAACSSACLTTGPLLQSNCARKHTSRMQRTRSGTRASDSR